ncbi:spore germination protein [Brevibacillus choshinensis]|uniref:spore germination protein n=1 Tax=Brevibacillus choshinensis TaxID=54911 RepID=UPI002E220F42|nr:spore germination protein [Brevibacillus choshinensis]MED4753826.1 spore germination protein [Brevibacillus choshinensis]MED4781742.1 spore germination protein [Brevibacillus choshinensis]
MSQFWKAWQKRKDTLQANTLQKHADKSMESVSDLQLTTDVEENVSLIQFQLGKCDDLVVRRFQNKEGNDCAIVFLDGMVDRNVISQFIITYMTTTDMTYEGPATNELEATDRLRQVIRNILSGTAVLMIDGESQAYLNNTRGWDRRGVEEPQTESVVRGPRDGFCETLCVNSALIRFRLKDPNLRVRHMVVGQRTQTDIYVMYIEGLAHPPMIEEIMSRIDKVNVDAVLESGYIEQLIQDRRWSPFPQIQNTERPDKVVANLLEGKAGILVDGTPFGLVAPAVFSQFYQSPEDYYERFYIATLIRLIRIISISIALLLPSLYIAFSSFHPEMIPSRLVIAMAAGRSTVPFPSLVEALFMELAIEILREASVRLPGPIGPTIGIVGALVVGEAAVTAGLVSPVMVIIVAVTTIGSFASPSYSAAIAIRMLRFPVMALAGMFGLYGIMLFLIVIMVHLSSIKSFGVPYMSPLSPLNLLGMRDLFIRAPHHLMKTRPGMFHVHDKVRMREEDKP